MLTFEGKQTKLYNFDQFILKQRNNRAKEILSDLYSFIYHTKTVAKVATKPKVAREKVLVALATESVAISSPTAISKLWQMNKYQTASCFLFRSTINKICMSHMSSAVRAPLS